jgi:hypothetical protein
LFYHGKPILPLRADQGRKQGNDGQAGFFVRPCIVPGAPHYWMNDLIEEVGSFSGFLAPRLLRFLAERL